ncbi:MAG: hypothetical protein P1U36_02195 [Legionellaceae bacterium]|nr:hypothetical protein [Legionellaceae bacterium]
MIRLHPKTGGVNINFGDQYFHGVSADVFFGLDLNDFSQTYQNSRKFNLSISVNPSCWSTEDLLSYLTLGELERTSKCDFHGDIETKLHASKQLKKLLKLEQLGHVFVVDGMHYIYDSIGVACNRRYQSVSHRQGNAFEKSSSHFEIKFRRQPSEHEIGEQEADEYLCLNIHFMPENTRAYGKGHTLERLKQAIHLFYAELDLPTTPVSYTSSTSLKIALRVTLDNYEELGFSCKHKKSQNVIERHALATHYTHSKSNQRGLSLWDYVATSEETKLHSSLSESVSSSVASSNTAPPEDDVKSDIKPVVNAWSKKLTL